MVQPKVELAPFFVSVLSLVTGNDRTSEEIYDLYIERLHKGLFGKIVGTSVRVHEIEDTLLYLAKQGYVTKSRTNFISEPLPEEVNIFRLAEKKVIRSLVKNKHQGSYALVLFSIDYFLLQLLLFVCVN